MRLTLIQIFFINCLLNLPTYFFSVQILLHLLNKKIKLYKYIIHTILISLGVAILGTIGFDLSDYNQSIWFIIRFNITSVIFFIFYFMIVFKEYSLRIVGATAIMQFLTYGTFYISILFIISVPGYKNLNSIEKQILLYCIFDSGLLFLLVRLMKRLKLKGFFSYFYKTRKRSIIFTIITLILMNSLDLCRLLMPQIMDRYSYVVAFILLVCITGIFIYTASYQQNLDKINSQQTLILQQQNYLQTLEKIQRDMRVLQHDYKNILSGLYLQATDGDIDGIQKYINRTLQQFSGDLEFSIKRISNLSNIELIELKSLILSKQAAMENRGIIFNIESVEPITKISMDTNDLVRCLGILLDNAAEAVSEMLEPQVNLMITKEQNNVTIQIKNPVKEKPVLYKIWEMGYSMKGKNRGLGLFSLIQIIENYPNVIRETSCNEMTFTQIIKIHNK